MELVDLWFMLAWTILFTWLVEVASVTHELKAAKMGSWAGIRQVRWWFVLAGSGSCGTESRYFGAEGIAHHVFDCSNNFDFILSVCSRTRVLILESSVSVFHRVKRCHTARIKVEIRHHVYENYYESTRAMPWLNLNLLLSCLLRVLKWVVCTWSYIIWRWDDEVFSHTFSSL